MDSTTQYFRYFQNMQVVVSSTLPAKITRRLTVVKLSSGLCIKLELEKRTSIKPASIQDVADLVCQEDIPEGFEQDSSHDYIPLRMLQKYASLHYPLKEVQIRRVDTGEPFGWCEARYSLRLCRDEVLYEQASITFDRWPDRVKNSIARYFTRTDMDWNVVQSDMVDKLHSLCEM